MGRQECLPSVQINLIWVTIQRFNERVAGDQIVVKKYEYSDHLHTICPQCWIGHCIWGQIVAGRLVNWSYYYRQSVPNHPLLNSYLFGNYTTHGQELSICEMAGCCRIDTTKRGRPVYAVAFGLPLNDHL